MGQIQTGSVCPFPRTFSQQVLDANGGISAGLSSDKCDVTYGEFLSPGYLAFQIILGVWGVLFFVVFAVKMTRLHLVAESKGQIITRFVQFRFFSLGLFISILLTIEAVDLFAFRGIYPAEIYFVCDELIAIALFSIVVELVDWWSLNASIGRKKKSGIILGFSWIEKWIFRIVYVTNFLGFIIIAMVDFTNFFLWEGVKSIIASFILAVMLGRAVIKLKAIRTMLLSAAESSDKGGQSYHSPVLKEESAKHIKVMQRKFVIFVFIITIAIVALFFNALVSWQVFDDLNGEKPDLRWEYRIEEQIDAAQIILKGVYMATLLALSYFFSSPKREVPVEIVAATNLGSAPYTTPTNMTTVANARRGTPANMKTTIDEESEYDPGDIDLKFVGGQHAGLNEVLQDPQRRKKFAKFVSRKYASEAIRFYQKVMEFDALTSDAARLSKGKDIVKNFLVDGAPYEVNISASVRKNLSKLNEFPPGVFTAAAKETYALLETNFYEPFKGIIDGDTTQLKF